MGELFKVLAAKIEEHSVAFVFLTAAVSAVLGALAKLVFDTVLTGRYTDLKESRRVLSRYRNPLLQSADAVRGRIENYVTAKQGHGFEGSDEYYKLSTLYVFSSYFAWVELLVGRLSLLRFESSRRNRALNRLILNVDKAFNNRQYFRSIPAHMYADDSDVPKFICKAIGELSSKRDKDVVSSLDFVEFVRKYKQDAEFRGWLSNLERFLVGTRQAPGNVNWDRLHIIQIALLALINFLDPAHELTPRLPTRHPRKILERIQNEDAREVVASDAVRKRLPIALESSSKRSVRQLSLVWESVRYSWLGSILRSNAKREH